MGSDFRQNFVDLMCLISVLCGRSGINASTTTGCEGSIPQRNPSRHTAPMPSRRLLLRSRHPRRRPPHPPLGAVVMPEQSGAEGVPGRGKRVALAGCGGIYTRIEGKMRGDVPLRTYTGLYGLIRAYTSLYAPLRAYTRGKNQVDVVQKKKKNQKKTIKNRTDGESTVCLSTLLCDIHVEPHQPCFFFFFFVYFYVKCITRVRHGCKKKEEEIEIKRNSLRMNRGVGVGEGEGFSAKEPILPENLQKDPKKTPHPGPHGQDRIKEKMGKMNLSLSVLSHL